VVLLLLASVLIAVYLRLRTRTEEPKR
jgi:hypothetical protein